MQLGLNGAELYLNRHEEGIKCNQRCGAVCGEKAAVCARDARARQSERACSSHLSGWRHRRKQTTIKVVLKIKFSIPILVAVRDRSVETC